MELNLYSLNKILQACVLAPIKTTYDLNLDLFMKNMGQLKADSTLQQSALTYFECVKRRVYPAHIIPNDYKHLMQYTLSIKWQIMASTYQSRKLVQNNWHSRFKKNRIPGLYHVYSRWTPAILWLAIRRYSRSNVGWHKSLMTLDCP